MSARSELRGMRDTHAVIADKLADAAVGTRAHELLSDLHYHLGHVIEISEQLLKLEDTSGGD